MSDIDDTIDYFFTPSSPWTYLGHRRFVALATKFHVGIRVKPIDLTNSVMPVSGGLPVSKRSKQRLAYRAVELRRWSLHLEMPLNLAPRAFPVATDLASRMIIAADATTGSDTALALTGGLLAAVWSQERDISQPDTLIEIASEVGLDGSALLFLAQKERTKKRYADYTAEAIDLQVFGAPFYIYRGEPFWGQDRLAFLEHALKQASDV